MAASVDECQISRHDSAVSIANCADLLSIAMNKFLKKRPTDGPAANDDALNALAQPTSPALKKSSTSRWKKNNSSHKRLPEPKPQLDLSAVLPPSDDFRTSLIMPSLSTRFSMLREQDDPKSMLGKASDDSVLSPRRKSRLADFGHGMNGLSDIAEVSSIRDSFRPPFAQDSRQNSYVSEDEYGSEADATPGGMMGRSRPGEGNNLFGGRQKIYKIPTSGTNSTRSLGKLMYEDDVGMSAFQKYRQREREQDDSQLPRPSDESQRFDFGLDQAEPGGRDDIGYEPMPNDSAKDLSHSPSLSSYDRKRSTTSSTARSDARSSTAATSIASQSAISGQSSVAHPNPTTAPIASVSTAQTTVPAPMSAPLLDRSNTKARRLYDHGLDQHMQEQQTSAITRLNSIQRSRALSGKKSPPLVHNARSVGSLHDRAQPGHHLRNQSPQPISPLPQLNTNGVRRANSTTSSPVLSGPQSPVEYESNEVLNQALEPGDRGKATAMGAFNKPAHAFDEKQYLERQRALQRSASNAVVKNKAAVQAAVQERIDRGEQSSQSPSPDLSAQEESRPSSRKQEARRAYNVFQNALSQFQGTAPSPPHSKSPLPDTHRTFFGNISASEDEEEEEDAHVGGGINQSDYGYGGHSSRWQPTPLHPVSEHPQIRNQRSKSSLAEVREELEPKSPRQPAFSPSAEDPAPADAEHKTALPLDSPTLGPEAQPLTGMVHHLRQPSNQSSLYAADDTASYDGDYVPQVPDVPWMPKKSDSLMNAIGNTLDTASAHGSMYATSNPWDLDEQSLADRAGGSRCSVSPIDNTTDSAAPSRQSARSLSQDRAANSRPWMQRKESDTSLVPEMEVPAWQQELKKQHHRDASTATQQERDAFANELAARRAAIQESIRNKNAAESQSRGTSPAPAAPSRAFGMLRSKTSGESMARAQDQPPRAVVGFQAMKSAPDDRSGRSFEATRFQGSSSPRPPMLNGQHPALRSDPPSQPRGVDYQQAERPLASSRARAPSASRSRSNSVATTGRSRSRTGPYRDDLEKAMVEGHGSSAAAHTPDVSPFPGASPVNSFERTSEEDVKPAPNYFEHRGGNAFAQQAKEARQAVNGAIPVTLAPSVYTPGRPAPLANPYSQNTTPPLSTVSSPAAGTTPALPPSTASSVRGGTLLRKKTISKSDISEPTLIASTSNVDTVELPEGASLKNGMEDPPPIPPINPRRRATRKIFARVRAGSSTDGDYEPKATASDPNLLSNVSSSSSSPQKGEYHFPPSNVVRMPTISSKHDAEQYAFDHPSSPERQQKLRPNGGAQRAVTAPLDGGMF